MKNVGTHIWLNGRLRHGLKNSVSLLEYLTTHSLHYGSSVFEGLRLYRNENGGSSIFRMDDHVDRLFFSAQTMNMQLAYSKGEIKEAIRQTVAKNNFREGYIRPIAFYQKGFAPVPRKGSEMVAIMLFRLPPLFKKPLRVNIATLRRFHPSTFVSEAKVGGAYFAAVIAGCEALYAGCDEALFLDTKNHIAEGAGDNVFLVMKNELVTPRPICSLPGITRDTIIRIARGTGIHVSVRNVLLKELQDASEAFVTGTAAEVVPIKDARLSDGKIITIGSGKIGPITKLLREAYLEIVRGGDQRFEGWLTPV